jgi:hypothetical protein
MWFFPLLAASRSLYSRVFDKSGPKPWLLYFSTEKCEMCNEAENVFNETRKFIGDAADYASLDANKDFKISARLMVTNVPAFVVIYKGNKDVFEGEPNKERLFNFMGNLLGKDVPILKDSELKGKGKMVVGFTKRIKTPSYIAFASKNITGHGIKFGYVNKQSLFDEYEIKKTPAAIFMNNGEFEKYEGADDVPTFLKEVRRYFNIESVYEGDITEQMKTDL